MPPSGRRDDLGPSPPTGPILLLVDFNISLAPPIPWPRLHVLLVPLHAPPPLLYADDVAVLAPFPPTLPPALLLVVSLPTPSLVASFPPPPRARGTPLFLCIALSY